MRRPLFGVLGGLVASGSAIGLAMATGAGADLIRFLHVAALVFVVAGVLAGRGPSRAAAVGVVIGGAAPVIGLAIAGVAFRAGVWWGTFVVAVVVATATGVASRRYLDRAARIHALATVAIAGLIFVGAIDVIVPRLLREHAIERGSRVVAPLELATADGARIAAGDWADKVVVLAFWATWCEPCRAELPELRTLHARYRDDPRVVVLSVNAGTGGDTVASAREFARTAGWDLPLAFTTEGQAMHALGLTGLPGLVLLDRAGRQRVTHRGFDRAEGLASLIAGEIDRLLAER